MTTRGQHCETTPLIQVWRWNRKVKHWTRVCVSNPCGLLILVDAQSGSGQDERCQCLFSSSVVFGLLLPSSQWKTGTAEQARVMYDQQRSHGSCEDNWRNVCERRTIQDDVVETRPKMGHERLSGYPASLGFPIKYYAPISYHMHLPPLSLPSFLPQIK